LSSFIVDSFVRRKWKKSYHFASSCGMRASKM
jgi:hypothetical protein